MRDVKFRGKRIDNGMWVYGGYHLHEDKKLCIATTEQRDANKRTCIIVDRMADWGMSVPIMYIEVDPKTVGECTGLLDKNGKEIYEGDILKNEFGEKVVKWDQGGFYLDEKRTIMRIYFWSIDLSKIEVIGNEFENPDLC